MLHLCNRIAQEVAKGPKVLRNLICFLDVLFLSTSKKSLLVVRYRCEGWRGFYKGLSVNLMRVTPATVITFLVYENVTYFLKHNPQYANIGSNHLIKIEF
ncbi:mitochondrial folate transporter/carrier [Vespula squamosa]|uniref:Mitochondrial folate transporter/carrier n=1 Tax=Vespula squamosa TaxID=30214 RepID=A0ABD2AF47_VESSQ